MASLYLQRVSGALLLVVGIILVSGGVYLAFLGGSICYLVVGTLVCVSGQFYIRAHHLGERLFVIVLGGTLLWSLAEAGLNPWGLTARLFGPAILGLWLSLPWVRRRLGSAEVTPRLNEPALASLAVLLVLVIAFVNFQSEADATGGALSMRSAHADASPLRDTDWQNYGNGLNGQRFSTLSQINAENVHGLRVAWVHRWDDPTDASLKFSQTAIRNQDKNQAEATPIKIGGNLYSCTPSGDIYAVDAATGRQIWRSTTGQDISRYRYFTCRGISYFHAARANADGLCADRIIGAAMGGILQEMDAKTGQPCRDFGTAGRVSLFSSMGQVDPVQYKTTSPPTVVGDLVVIGSLVTDGFDTDMPSGVIKAFDAKTGGLRWAWDAGAPTRIGAPPKGENFTRNTPNAWGIFSADEKLGLIYIATGNAGPDFYGLHRRPFDEKYSSSIVALNIADGRPRWSYQTTHHDLWDYDVSAQPVLIDLPARGGPIPAVLQPTKRGDVFVLDRRTGRPIVGVHEVPAPGAGLPDERLSKSQPISDLSFIPPPLTEREMWGATPIDQMLCRIRFRAARTSGIFTPPGLRTTIVYPGQAGGIDWSSVSVDDDRKVMIANPSYFPWEARMIPRERVPDADNTLWPQRHTPFVLHNVPFLGALGMPCKQPPWGSLAAVDLRTGRVIWNKVVGTARDTGPLGMRIGPPLLIGTPSLGGTIVTRGGIVFMAATFDNYLRAFDEATGRQIWQFRLPASAQATPMTYMSAGRQYVVIVAGGHAGVGTAPGDYTIAFALPGSVP